MSYVPDDPDTPENEEDAEVYHNWVTIFTCNPSDNRSTDNGIHLDPWIGIKIGAYTAQIHKELMLSEIQSPINDGNRNFYSTGSYPKEWLIGTFIDTDETTYSISFTGVIPIFITEAPIECCCQIHLVVPCNMQQQISVLP